MSSEALVAAVLVVALLVLAGWSVVLYRGLARAGRLLGEARAELARTEKLRIMGEMTAGFAHSFNDVLTPIIGRAQLARQRVADPQVLEWLAAIERAALDGAQTVWRIQDFIRIRPEGYSVPVDVNALVRAVAEAARHAARDSVTVTTQLATPPDIPGDPGALREALSTLVANALDAMPTGGSLALAAYGEGDEAVITVRDTGIGMTEDLQRTILSPFFTTKREASGLGLSLADGIVSRHGGQLQVESAPGSGTTIRLRFPVRPRAERTRGTGELPRTRDPAAAVRCLVVDDDDDVRGMLQDALESGGHHVVVARDGAEGLDKFKTDTFDVVITDLAMPRMNGVQLARDCKQLKPAVHIVMITGWGVGLSSGRLADYGVDRILAKPLSLNAILTAVSPMLS
jgi:CheY-like chemotaxis protein/nitrogen-specific signal transduction histidine kinase